VERISPPGSPNAVRLSPPNSPVEIYANLTELHLSPSTIQPAKKDSLIEPAVSSFGQHDFSEAYEDEMHYFQVIKMRDSVFVWGGDSSKMIGHMTTAIQTKWDPMPTASTVLGKDDTDWIEPYASKLGKRLKTVLHLSLNFGNCSFEKQMFVQKTLASQLPSILELLTQEQQMSTMDDDEWGHMMEDQDDATHANDYGGTDYTDYDDADQETLAENDLEWEDDYQSGRKKPNSPQIKPRSPAGSPGLSGKKKPTSPQIKPRSLAGSPGLNGKKKKN